MALTKCTECHKDMSDTLIACPHCGFKKIVQIPVSNENKNNNFCIHCGKPYDKDNSQCPYCNAKNIIAQTSDKPTPNLNSNNTISADCGKPYYKGASKCPYCKTKNVNKKTSYGLIIAIVTIAVLIGFVIFNEDKNHTTTSNTTQDLKPSTSNSTSTNGKIRYTVGGYAAAPTEEILDRVTELSISKDYSALQQLLDSGLIIQLKGGTRVEVVKKKFAVVKLWIFGTNSEYWAVIEALKNQP